MSSKVSIASTLRGKTIAVPESRQLDVLTALFERRGAEVIRVPLVTIHDTPDQESVIQWLYQFIKEPPDYFIILTGEGLRRLCAAAQRQQIESQFLLALKKVLKICRGPKPVRALTEMNLKPDLLGSAPTTAGIIETLDSLSLAGSRITVQLYGEDPNLQLMQYLDSLELSSCSTVAPYIYANDADNERVRALILKLAAGEVDVIAFTSKPQVRRLFEVARQSDLEEELQCGMANTNIAAVGPVVKEVLSSYGCEVCAMPSESYFMKPLVRSVELLYADSGE